MKTREVKNAKIARLFGAKIDKDELFGVYVVYPDGNKVEANKLKYHRSSREQGQAERFIIDLGYNIHLRGGSDYFEYGITGQGFNEIRRITGDNIPKRGNDVRVDVMVNFSDWYEKNKQ